jgi:N-acetylglutamate synthase-like GNAT family acetyltransferase
MHKSVSIDPATHQDLQQIRNFVAEYRLDDEQLDYHQFLVARDDENVIGFGRIREYEDCSELCSLGVFEPERNKGVGTALTAALKNKARNRLFLVCIIPEFFEKHGFKITEDFPQPLRNKLYRCETSLSVPEKYVVMELK